MKSIFISLVLASALGAQAAPAPDTLATAPMKMGPALVAVNQNGVAGRRSPSAVLMYDAFTGATTLTTTGGSPRTYMGTPFTVAPTGSNVSVTAARVYLASTAAQTYSNGLVIRLQFWDGFDGATNPIFATAVPADPPGGVQTATIAGPITLAVNTYTPIDITFTTPIPLNGNVNNGIVINYQGDNGSGPVSVDTLTSLICTVPATGPHTLAVGSLVGSGSWASPQFGFYRNVANQTTFNHANTDLRTFAGQDDIRLCLQLTGDVTPVELQGFSIE